MRYYEKKNNAWIIRRLVDDSFVQFGPATQRESQIDGFLNSIPFYSVGHSMKMTRNPKIGMNKHFIFQHRLLAKQSGSIQQCSALCQIQSVYRSSQVCSFAYLLAVATISQCGRNLFYDKIFSNLKSKTDNTSVSQVLTKSQFKDCFRRGICGFFSLISLVLDLSQVIK